MLVLFDNSMLRTVAHYLLEHHTNTKARGWGQLENCRLLDTAEASAFEVFVTADRNLSGSAHAPTCARGDVRPSGRGPPFGPRLPLEKQETDKILGKPGYPPDGTHRSRRRQTPVAELGRRTTNPIWNRQK
jgi:hypothetical protein